MPFEDAENIFSARSSHFEKRWFADEIMTGIYSYHGRFTKLSLAMAQDSGFYKADLSLGEEFYFNKNQGCKAYSLGHKCPTELSGFCKKREEKFCSANHDYLTKCNDSWFVGGNCGINENIDYCKNEKETDDPYATYGKSSKCNVFVVNFF